MGVYSTTLYILLIKYFAIPRAHIKTPGLNPFRCGTASRTTKKTARNARVCGNIDFSNI